jgi:hypothetical protein
VLTFVGLCNPAGELVYRRFRIPRHKVIVAQNNEPEMERDTDMIAKNIARTIIWEFPVKVFKGIQKIIANRRELQERADEARWYNG